MKQVPGYTLVHTEACPEQHGTLTVLTHDVSGAAVLLVENRDNNKAFGIGFGTFPSDDTGVFHILEHSVLSGSEKYPVQSPFVQLLKSSMASFLNAMTFPDKTVYPFATPNETDFYNLLDIYMDAVFRPLAMKDRSVFEQEGWHRAEDGSVSGVVYNEMQGAMASPDAQLQYAINRALFPDTSRGYVSGGDPACIPALTYEKYLQVYRRHYRPDNCCITLYGDLDMARALEVLDKNYLSGMPKGGPRPRPAVQQPQNGVCVRAPYRTEKPDPHQTQCALAWYTGDFADRERQLGVEILLAALLGNNQSPLKAALLEQGLGADLDQAFDDSNSQPFLELVLRGATEETALRFADSVKASAEKLLEKGIPRELLLAALNATEFASLERPGSLPDGVADAINAASGWLNADEPALLLHTNHLFAALREKLDTGWFDALAREIFLSEPVQVLQVQALPEPEPEKADRTDEKLRLQHPLQASDLGEGAASPAGSRELLAGAELLRHPSAGSLYLNFYYDLGGVDPEEMPYLQLMTAVLDELDTPRHTARELTTLRDTWLGQSGVSLVHWSGRQEGRPCHAKLTMSLSLLERSLEKAVELGGEWLYETRLTGPTAEAAFERVITQQKLMMEQMFIQQGHSFALARACSHFTVEDACGERCSGVSYYKFLCGLLEQADWAALGARLERVRGDVLHTAALTVSLHGSEAALETLRRLLPGSAFAQAERAPAKPYVEPLPAPVNEAFIIDGEVHYDILAWPMDYRAERRVLSRVVSYEYLWRCIREEGGAYGTGMLPSAGAEALYTYRDPHVRESYAAFAAAPAALAERDFTDKDLNEFIVGAVAKMDTPRKPCELALELDRRYFCGGTEALRAADRAALCGMTPAALREQTAGLAEAMAAGVRVAFGSREGIEGAKDLFDRVEVLG